MIRAARPAWRQDTDRAAQRRTSLLHRFDPCKRVLTETATAGRR